MGGGEHGGGEAAQGKTVPITQTPSTSLSRVPCQAFTPTWPLTLTKLKGTVKVRVLEPLSALAGACKNLRKFGMFKVQLTSVFASALPAQSLVGTAHLDLASTLPGPCRR